jgi:hypothetical protein
MSIWGRSVRHRVEGGERKPPPKAHKEALQMQYMLTIIGPEGGMEDASPEEMQADMEAWFEVTRELEESGDLKAGEALQPSETGTTIRLGDGGERLVTDGPYAETKEQIGGFYLVDCDNLDQALEWAKKLPIRAGGVEVRPVVVFDEAQS